MKLKIAVGIATAGRREVLSETMRFLALQSRPADELFICPANPQDVDDKCLEDFPSRVKIVSSPAGLCVQRNNIIKSTTSDVLVFFDDDFLPDQNFLAEVENLFVARHDVVIATGNVLADGIMGPGLSFDEGRRLLEEKRERPTNLVAPVNNGYGCNMAIRLAPVRANNLSFDERLPRYSWLEDVDFSRQLAKHGLVVKVHALQGVHLGTKRSGRTPGKTLGYSQVANRIYILRKGNMTLRQALEGNLKNIIANIWGSLHPEPYIDRRGRLFGNWLAIKDWIFGKVDPENIIKF